MKAANSLEDLFTKDAMQHTELNSKENRRVIMNLCGNSLDLPALRRKKAVTDELVKGVCD